MTRAKKCLDKILSASVSMDKWAVFEIRGGDVTLTPNQITASSLSHAIKQMNPGLQKPKARITEKEGYKVASLLWPNTKVLVEVVPVSAVNLYKTQLTAAKDTGDKSKDKSRRSALVELSNKASALEENLDALPEAAPAIKAVAGLRELDTALAKAQAKLKSAPGNTEEAQQAQSEIDKMRLSIDQMLPVVVATMDTLVILLDAANEIGDQYQAVSEQAKALEVKLKEEKERLSSISEAVKHAVGMNKLSASSSRLLSFLQGEVAQARKEEEEEDTNGKEVLQENMPQIIRSVLSGDMYQAGTDGSGVMSFDDTPATTKYELLLKSIRNNKLSHKDLITPLIEDSSFKNWSDVDTDTDLVIFRYETPDNALEVEVDSEELARLANQARQTPGAIEEVVRTLREDGVDWDYATSNTGELSNSLTVKNVRGRWAACLQTEDLLDEVLASLSVVEINDDAQNPAWWKAARLASKRPQVLLPILRGNDQSVIVLRSDIPVIEDWASTIQCWADSDETPIAVREAVREDVYTNEA